MKNFKTMTAALGSLAVGAAGLLGSSAALAEVQFYSSANGAYGTTWNGALNSGPLGGSNVSDQPANTYVGTTDGHLGWYNAAGGVDWYNLAGHVATPTTLVGGTLAGSTIASNKANFLGVMDSFYYFASPQGVLTYSTITNVEFPQPAGRFTQFSGGVLNGVTLARGVGALDMGGNTDMENQFIRAIDSGGMADYYYGNPAIIGNFFGGTQAVNGFAYDNWTTLSGTGSLAGLTLSAVQAAPVGTFNGVSYRFLGTNNNAMLFDVPIAAVPEASTYLMMALGLSVVGLHARRRKTA